MKREFEIIFIEKDRLDDLLKQEETYWKQRAKAFWLSEGDTNSKFFHAQDTIRKKANRIVFLRNEQDEIIDNHEEMCNMAIQYFTSVFAGDNGNNFQHRNSENRVITDRQNTMLTKELEFDEFTKEIKQMHPDKASGPDGFSPAFFQHFWGLIGKEIFESCKCWLRDVSFPPELNNTTLVLIPKKDNMERMSEVRHIALCNVLYKNFGKGSCEQTENYPLGHNLGKPVCFCAWMKHYR
ncbi:hypothetical protein AgCh_030071 [Apium graveolens]